jgi:aminobenzoyl-glutamate transport protein
MGGIERVLNRIEVVGNRLPDPVTLFVILIGVIFGLSALLSFADVSAVNPSTKESVGAVNLFSSDIIRRLFAEMPKTFTSFAPLGTVLVVMIGVGVAERSGFVAVGLSGFVRRVPRILLTPAVVFAGVMSSLTVDAGYVVLIPLAGILFAAAGRNPIAGIAAAFAGVSAGYSANLLITPLDILLAGLTQSSGQILEPGLMVPPTANYYLMVALVPVFVVIGSWVTDRLIEPRLVSTNGANAPQKDESAVTVEQVRGLKYAGWVTLAVLAGVLLITLPEGAPLRVTLPEGAPPISFTDKFKPFLDSLVALISLGFLLIGIAFGVGARTIQNDKDVVKMTSDTMSDMGLYLVLAFVAAHFIVLFSWSNLGIILAINGADVIRATGLTGSALVILLVALAGIINLFIGSATAKWALIGPVLVPMFMLVGLDPEVTQAAYRIGDSVTNILTPLMPYFPMVLVFAHRYDKNFGIGSLAAVMLPFSVAFGIGATLLLVIWMLAGIPLGPGLG